MSLIGKILIVDDEPCVLEILGRQLEGLSYKVYPVLSAYEALEVIQNEEIDILLTDVRMPEIDGIELIQQSIKIRPELQCIVITGHGDKKTAVEAMKLGAINFLDKPLHVEEVEMAVRYGMERRRLVREVMEKQKKLEEANKELTRHKNHLEEFVRERISEISGVNDSLREEITGHKQTEEKLRETKQFLEKVMESATNAIYVIDLNGKFQMVNRAATEISGYQIDELIGKHYSILFDPEILPVVNEKFIATSVHGIPVKKFETVINRKDGVKRNITFSSAPIYQGNKITNIAGTAEDITVRKRAEEKLLKAKENAEKATKLKDQFVGLVAHDLKSPLASILGFLEYIYKDEKFPIHRKHRELFGKLLENGRQLLKTIDELLKISRFQTGAIVPTPVFSDAHLIAGSVVSHLTHMANDKGVRLVNKVPRRTRIYVDPSLFNEVLLNLVSNSIKFSECGARVTIFTPQNKNYKIAVKDTGIGISEKLIPMLFRPDIQTSTTGTKGEKGTGLGLPFSYDIIKAHGGMIKVNTRMGEGTCILVQLPDIKPKVMIVDDNEEIRSLVESGMEGLGVDTMQAKNGKEALDLIAKYAPHLVILDLKMPVMSGFEFMEHIKKDPEKKSIPIIIITADNEVETRERVLEMGADDFVSLPFVFPDFISRVKKFVV